MGLRVLVLCTGNSARSQMAEALLRHLSNGTIEASSAGTHPRPEIHPMARVAIKQLIGDDMPGQFPKTLDRYLGERFDFVITVCDQAAEECPVFPGAARRLHWSFPDPAAATGTPEAQQGEFNRIAREIEQRIRAWMAEMSRP